MKVGLGTGSTAAFAVERLGQKMASNLCTVFVRFMLYWSQASGELTDIVAVPTSVRTKEQAEYVAVAGALFNNALLGRSAFRSPRLTNSRGLTSPSTVQTRSIHSSISSKAAVVHCAWPLLNSSYNRQLSFQAP